MTHDETETLQEEIAVPTADAKTVLLAFSTEDNVLVRFTALLADALPEEISPKGIVLAAEKVFVEAAPTSLGGQSFEEHHKRSIRAHLPEIIAQVFAGFDDFIDGVKILLSHSESMTPT